jgi:hypothetical protein
MTETVTVLRPTGFTQSPSGEPTPTFESAMTVMYLEPRQDTRRSTEAIEVGYDKVFDILAPPRVIPNPRLGTLSHTELDLQTVGGPGVDAIATPGTVGGVGG